MIKERFLRNHTCPDHRSDSFLSSFGLRHIYSFELCSAMPLYHLLFPYKAYSQLHFAIPGLSAVFTVRNSRLRRKKKGKPCCNQQYLRIQYYLGHLLMPSDIICQLYADITLRNAHRLSITSSLSESYFPCTIDAGLSATSDPSSPTYTTIWHYSDSLMQRQLGVVLSPCASQSSLY